MPRVQRGEMKGLIEVVDDVAHAEGEGEGVGEGAHIREGRSSGGSGE